MNTAKTILLIDDDLISNFINTRVLFEFGIKHEQILTANNGLEGIKYMRNSCKCGYGICPELVFLDINMPVMNGFEFLEMFEKLSFDKKENVRIVMLTSSQNPKDIERVKKFGITDYLKKPLTVQSVQHLIVS